MSKGTLKTIYSILILFCMLCTQVMSFTPVKAEVPENISNIMVEQNLFTSKTTVLGQEYAMFRIPGIISTQNGTMIAYCEARKSSGDKDPMDILMRRSTDGGKTWGEPVRLVEGVSTSTTVGNPVMVAEKNSSTVHFLYTKNYSQVYYMKSTDNGATWSTGPVNLTPVFDGYNQEEPGTWQSIATGPGHAIQLDNGRLLVPFWLSASSASWARCSIGTIYSDDGGITWGRGEILHYDDRTYSLGEPVVAQLSDGSVMINIRCGATDKLRAVSVSPDGISGWSAPYLDSTLTDSGCFGSIVRLPAKGPEDKDRLLFVNVSSQTAREHLTLRMSEDDGKTWPYSRVIKLGGAAYSDIVVGLDRTICVFYEKEQPCAYLSVASFGLNWLTSPPTMAQLNNIEIPEADIAPAFMSEIYNYDIMVEGNATSINITPRAFPNSRPTIVINGQPAVNGTATTVPLIEDKTQILVDVTAEGGSETKTYTIKATKRKLVTNWKFEKSVTDVIYDSSGMGNSTAAFYGSEYVQGYIGKALKFDNTAYVDVAGIESTKFGTGDFTITAWVNPSTIDSVTRTLFWYGNTDSNNMSQWWVRTKSGSSGKAQLEFSTGEKTNVNGVVTGGETFTATSRYFLVPGEWHHVAIQRKGGVTQIFVDGVLDVSKGATPKNVSKGPLTNLYIGKAKTGAVRNWLGYIDEVRMYNYGLDPGEIQVLASQSPVNTEALDAKITEAKALNSTAYTAQSWANLQAAITAAEAQLDQDSVTQAIVDQVAAAIQTTIISLVHGYPVTVTANGENGGAVAGSGVYAEGDRVTVTAAVYSGYTFTGWTQNGVVVSTNSSYSFTMGIEPVSLTANFLKKGEITVTANPSNGGAITGGGIYNEGDQVTVTAAAFAGYTFTNWTQGSVTVSTESAYTFTMGSAEVDLTANFTRVSGSSGGGSHTPAPVTEPEVKASISAGTANMNLVVAVDKIRGYAATSMKLDDIRAVLSQEKSIAVKIPEILGVKTYSLELPAWAFASKDAEKAVNLSTAVGNVTIPSNMLAGTDMENAGTLTITIGKGDKETLPQQVKEAIGNKLLVDLILTVNGQQKAWNNLKAPIKVSLPYTPSAAELANPEHIVVWYVDEAGNAVPVPNGKYDANAGVVTFTTTHFGKYAAAYVHKTFTDVKGYEWAKKQIEVLASKGVINGTSQKTFSPGIEITRAEYLYLLVRTLGLKADVTDNFSDVGAGDYYYKELGIARNLGITTGIGDNKFSPDRQISRQDIMVLTERALRTLEILDTKGTGSSLEKFTDWADIDSYAVDSIATLVKSGLIEGDGNRIAPMGETTRAEAAVFLFRIYNLESILP